MFLSRGGGIERLREQTTNKVTQKFHKEPLPIGKSSPNGLNVLPRKKAEINHVACPKNFGTAFAKSARGVPCEMHP